MLPPGYIKGPTIETFWLETACGQQDRNISVTKIIPQGPWALAAQQPDPESAVPETQPFPTTVSLFSAPLTSLRMMP